MNARDRLKTTVENTKRSLLVLVTIAVEVRSRVVMVVVASVLKVIVSAVVVVMKVKRQLWWRILK